MTIQELIAAARIKYSPASYSTLAEVYADRDKPISVEEKTVLTSIAQEITAILNRQILVQYLIAMGIPENQWVEYSYNGVEIIHHVELS